LADNEILFEDADTSKSPLKPIVSFEQLPDSVLSSKKPFNSFKAPTPIQAASWPYLLAKRDVIGVAETGSGKTIAFGYPCICRLALETSAKRRIRAVIVSPTRELAIQIAEQMKQLASQVSRNVVCVYGGVDKKAQALSLKTADVVVATPGRLNDLINDGAADLSKVDFVVLDEADRMLDKGEDICRRLENINFGS
jgi:ATP-dependent RNA helicase DBP3